MSAPKPVMIANAQINLDDLKATAQQVVDAAWGEDEKEAARVFLRDHHKNAIFEVVMETLFGPEFFDEHFNPREKELGV